MRPRVAIFGAAGMLGRALVLHCREAGDDVAPFARGDCDIATPRDVVQALERSEPDFILNAAGATDVDRCEREPAWAYRTNVLGPRVLAQAARDMGARLLHVSTDYVFSGEKGDAYDELDAPAPVSVYGRTKLEGERAVLWQGGEHIVARTAWLFGPGGKSFVARIPEILREKGEVQAIDDQESSPTSAADAARVLRALAARGAGGLYHVCNAGRASYFGVAREAARALEIDEARVSPVPGALVPRAAPRPRLSALRSVALEAEGFPAMRPWEEAYRDFVRAGPSA